jgi:hypothetical protein
MRVSRADAETDALVANLETLGRATLGCQGSRTHADSSAFIPGKALARRHTSPSLDRRQCNRVD